MVFCFGTFCLILYYCGMGRHFDAGRNVYVGGISQSALVSRLLRVIDPDSDFSRDDRVTANRLLHCKADLAKTDFHEGSGAVRESGASLTRAYILAREKTPADISEALYREIRSMLDPEKTDVALSSIIDMIKSDESIVEGKKFLLCFGESHRKFSERTVFDRASVFAGALLYSVAYTHNRAGALCCGDIDDSYPGRNVRYRFTDNERCDSPMETYREYLFGAGESLSQVKTVLYQERLISFYDMYICNDVYSYTERNRRSSIRNISAKEVTENIRYCILRGTGGIGKSMMMRHLFFTAMKEGGETVPVFVPLKSYTAENIDLLRYVYGAVEQFSCEITPEQFEEDLLSGRFLLLLDGLDEIPSKYMKHFEEDFARFFHKYRKNCFVISSRPISRFLSYAHFSILELKPFRKEQALELIEKLDFRPDDPSVKRKFYEAVNSRLFDSHTSFASNPLLLNIMLMTFEKYAYVPSSMYKFYKKAYEVLSESHDATKGAYIRAFETGFDADRFEEYMAEFCARTYMAEQYTLSEDAARQRYYELDIRAAYNDTAKNFRPFMTDICANLCLMYFDADRFQFMHRSFQEYFCALYFSRLMDRDIARAGEVFDERPVASSGADKTFEMLYDMIPEKVETLIFLPCLRRIFAVEEGLDAYWSFLLHVYPEIHYTTGETDGSRCGNDPMGCVYAFMAEHAMALHCRELSDDDFALPAVNDFEVGAFTAEDSDIAIGCGYAFSVPRLLDSRTDRGGGLYDVENYPEEYREIVSRLSDEKFPLMAEFRKMAEFYRLLVEKCVGRAARKSFF